MFFALDNGMESKRRTMLISEKSALISRFETIYIGVIQRIEISSRQASKIQGTKNGNDTLFVEVALNFQSWWPKICIWIFEYVYRRNDLWSMFCKFIFEFAFWMVAILIRASPYFLPFAKKRSNNKLLSPSILTFKKM